MEKFTTVTFDLRPFLQTPSLYEDVYGVLSWRKFDRSPIFLLPLHGRKQSSRWYLSRNKLSFPYTYIYIYIYQSHYHRDTRFHFPNRHDTRCMWHARSKRQSSSRVVKFRTIEILITWMHRENFIIFFYSPKNLLFSNLLFPSEYRFSSLWIKVSKRLKIPKSL